MPDLVWSERMSVGVAQLDEDHRELMRLINRLSDALEHNEGRAALGEIFDGLATYTEDHFAREEQVMEACGYSGLSDHRNEHRDFTRNMRYIRDRYFQGEGAEAGYDLLEQLKVWWRHHILLQDLAYKSSVEDFDSAKEQFA